MKEVNEIAKLRPKIECMDKKREINLKANTSFLKFKKWGLRSTSKRFNTNSKAVSTESPIER